MSAALKQADAMMKRASLRTHNVRERAWSLTLEASWGSCSLRSLYGRSQITKSSYFPLEVHVLDKSSSSSSFSTSQATGVYFFFIGTCIPRSLLRVTIPTSFHDMTSRYNTLQVVVGC